MADIRYDAHIDLQKNQLINALLHPVASDPASPVDGQVWFNTAEGRLKVRIAGSTATVALLTDVTGGAITGALWDANTIIKADTDNNPVPLTIGTNTVVGRLTGNITTLTAAQLRTLLNVEDGATADQTASEIKTLYESNTNTNAYTDTEKSKLAAIETGATADQTAAEILALLLTVDGAGTGLDADLLDGQHASAFALKSELDAAIQGLSWKDSVRAATTANITLSGTQTIDGVAVVAGDRVLVKNQTTQSGNGIYVVATGAWSRAADADTALELEGAAVMVEEGGQAGTAWIQNTDNFTLGSGNIVWAQFGAAQTYAAGSGLTLTGNTFSIAANAITDAMIASKNLAKRYSATIGDGTATQITVTHNLNTTDVIVGVRDASNGQMVLVDWRVVDANNVRLDFNAAPATGSRRVTVVG